MRTNFEDPLPSEGKVNVNGPKDGAKNRNGRSKGRPRSPQKFQKEIAQTLVRIDPNVACEVEELAKEGLVNTAESELLEYVTKDDHFSERRRFEIKRVGKDETRLDRRMNYVIVFFAAILLYGIFSVLFTGHISLPFRR
jgi:hypothetical protein